MHTHIPPRRGEAVVVVHRQPLLLQVAFQLVIEMVHELVIAFAGLVLGEESRVEERHQCQEFAEVVLNGRACQQELVLGLHACKLTDADGVGVLEVGSSMMSEYIHWCSEQPAVSLQTRTRANWCLSL